MSYPTTVSYFVRRLQGHTTNVFQLQPNGNPGTSTSGLGPNTILTFELPSNTLLDFSSIQLWFNAKATGSGHGRLPNNISSLIERYSLECGGQTIAQGFSSYGLVKQVKDILNKGTTGYKNVSSHYDLIRSRKSADGLEVPTSGDTNEFYNEFEVVPAEGNVSTNTFEETTPFCITDWCGFLGECKPQIIDTSLLGSLTLKIFLADGAVCTQSKGKGDGADFKDFITDPETTKDVSYSMYNVRLHATVYGINDGSYDMMIENQMNSQEFLEVPFTNYQTFFDGAHSGSSRFNVATQSLDMLYAVWREANYATIGHPIPVRGYKFAGAEATLGRYPDRTLQGSEFQGEKYITKYFNFPLPAGLKHAQFQLNGAMYPQWQANPREWLGITKDAVKGNGMTAIETGDQYFHHYAIHALRLCHPNSEAMRELSGLDTRSMNLSGVFQTDGTTTSPPCTIIAQMTNTLRIGKGLAVNLIV